MPDIRYAVFERDEVERVDGAGIVMPQPRAEDAQPPQLAAVFVRNDIVRVVAACPVIAEGPDRLSGKIETGHGAITAVRANRDFIEDGGEVGIGHSAFLARAVGYGGLVTDRQPRAIERHN